MRFPSFHPIESARIGLAERGYMAAFVLADYLEDAESDYSECGPVGRLLRMWYQQYAEWDAETKVRMTADFNKMLNEVNEMLGVEKTQNLVPQSRGTVATLSDPLGPFYMTLTASLNVLDSNMDWLSQNPIRKLVISRASSVADASLTSVFRNYRIANIESITLNGSFNINLLCEAISECNGQCLKTINIPYGVVDGNNRLKAAFYLSERIAKGCILKIGTRTITK